MIMSATASSPKRREARCTVCDSVSDRIVLRENGYEGRACSCGTIYVTPEPLPGEVDPTFVGHRDTFYDLSAAFKAAWVRRHTSGHHLLEIGCGTGAFLEAAQAAGFVVEGIEADVSRAAAAQRRLNARVHAAFFEEISIERGFDVVCHCDMLAHFERPAEALQAMKKYLRPGGVLAFEVGFMADLPLFWYSWFGEVGYPQHRWLYSERSLRKLLEKAGLRIEVIQVFDLSAYVAVQHVLRRAARFLRCVVPRGVVSKSTATRTAPRTNSGAWDRLLNVLRYRVGAWLPRIGPATALVVARPV